MKETDKSKNAAKILVSNLKALHDYFILSKLEVGIALVGTEVKVVRNGGVGITGAYVSIDNSGSLWLLQANFPAYEFGNRFNHDTLRPRRLLAHKREILKLKAQTEQKGMALIPLKMYVASNGRIKLEIGVARGKNVVDKRETIKRREADRDARRAMTSHNWR